MICQERKEKTERQQDQENADNMRRENLERANKDAPACGCNPLCPDGNCG